MVSYVAANPPLLVEGVSVLVPNTALVPDAAINLPSAATTTPLPPVIEPEETPTITPPAGGKLVKFAPSPANAVAVTTPAFPN